MHYEKDLIYHPRYGCRNAAGQGKQMAGERQSLCSMGNFEGRTALQRPHRDVGPQSLRGLLLGSGRREALLDGPPLSVPHAQNHSQQHPCKLDASLRRGFPQGHDGQQTRHESAAG